jgi:oxaloacetate decarboxylase gamma subunit
MTISDMLEQSGVLTLLGMGVVFGFLVILIIAISAAGKIINNTVRTQDVSPAVPAVQRTGNDAAITAVIGAAVNEYRKNK